MFKKLANNKLLILFLDLFIITMLMANAYMCGKRVATKKYADDFKYYEEKYNDLYYRFERYKAHDYILFG